MKLSNESFDTIAKAGSSIKTSKAKDLSGIYSLESIKDFSEITASEMEAKLRQSEKFVESWLSNILPVNVTGYVTMVKNGVKTSLYLNNALFNLLVEKKALQKKQNKKELEFTIDSKVEVKF